MRLYLTLLVLLLTSCTAPASNPTLHSSDTTTPKPQPSSTHTPYPLITPTPTSTLTPSPTITPSPSPSPTISAGEPYVIGTSVGGREIRVVRLGSGPLERLIVADIHGGYEENTNRLVNYMIEYLLRYPDQLPEGVTLYILKTLNPDGLSRSFDRYGRLNDNGVDLNRNFDSNWKSDWNRTGCWNYLPVSAGPAPESEPETQTLVKFIQEHPALDALISYHSAALGIFAGGSPPDPDSERLAELLSSVSGYNYPGYSGSCEMTGQLVDWAVDQGIAAVDIELNNHTGIDWVENRAVLYAFLRWER